MATAFVKHLCTVDGGIRARQEMYGLAIRQILNAVGDNIEKLTKDSVLQEFVYKQLHGP